MYPIICGLDKGHTTGQLAVVAWGDKNHISYSPKEFLLHADIVVRLEEKIKSLENYLIKHGHEMPDQSRRAISLQLIAFQKILEGDKPID